MTSTNGAIEITVGAIENSIAPTVNALLGLQTAALRPVFQFLICINTRGWLAHTSQPLVLL